MFLDHSNSRSHTADLLQLLELLLVLCSQLLNLTVVFQHELCFDSVHHVVPILLINPLRSPWRNRNHTYKYTQRPHEEVKNKALNVILFPTMCLTAVQSPASLGPTPGSSPSSWCTAPSWQTSTSPHSVSAPSSYFLAPRGGKETATFCHLIKTQTKH